MAICVHSYMHATLTESCMPLHGLCGAWVDQNASYKTNAGAALRSPHKIKLEHLLQPTFCNREADGMHSRASV